MRKTILEPAIGERIDAFDASSEIDGLQHSNGVAVELPGYTRVYLSGIAPIDDDENLVGAGDVEHQTRVILETIEGYLAELGGTMDDVVRVRVYTNQVPEAEFVTVHEVRSEFFSRDHYPASTLFEVEDLALDGMKIEIDADAIIPEDEWDVDTLSRTY